MNSRQGDAIAINWSKRITKTIKGGSGLVVIACFAFALIEIPSAAADWAIILTVNIVTVGHIFIQHLNRARLSFAEVHRSQPLSAEVESFKPWHGSVAAIAHSVLAMGIVIVVYMRTGMLGALPISFLVSLIQIILMMILGDLQENRLQDQQGGRWDVSSRNDRDVAQGFYPLL